MSTRGIAVFALFATLAGCAPPPPPLTDPRVFLTPDLGLLSDAPIVQLGTPMRASVRLVNPSAVDRPVIQTTDWITAQGVPIRTLLSTPQRLTVPRFGDAVIQAVAPTQAAVQFRIRVEPDYAAN